MQLICPAGHPSVDAEYCSFCGKPMEAGSPACVGSPPATNVISQPPSSTGPVMECPVCGTERDSPHARFCDTCRYDYVDAKQYEGGVVINGASNNAPYNNTVDTSTNSTDVQDQTVLTKTFNADALLKWDVVASVISDAQDPDGNKPTDLTEYVFALDMDDNLIGRRSDKDGIHPEIEISGDLGVSRRHARILRRDGKLILLDQSTNGTKLNGKDIPTRVETPFEETDEIRVGFWTRLKLRAR